MGNEIKFKRGIWGYNRGAVDRFMEKILRNYNDGYAQNKQLGAEVRKLRASNEEYVRRLAGLDEYCRRLQEENEYLRQRGHTGNIAE